MFLYPPYIENLDRNNYHELHFNLNLLCRKKKLNKLGAILMLNSDKHQVQVLIDLSRVIQLINNFVRIDNMTTMNHFSYHQPINLWFLDIKRA